MVVYQDSRIIEPKQFHRPRVRACGVNLKHHTASGRGVSRAPLSPNQSFTNSHHCANRGRIFHSTDPPPPVNGKAIQPLAGNPLPEPLQKGYSGARPAQFHTPTSQYSPYEHPPSAQLPQLPYPLWTIRQALLHAKSLSRVHLFPILNPPFLYSLLWFISSALMIHGRTLDPVPCK